MENHLPERIENHLNRLLEASTGDWSDQEGALEGLKTLWIRKDQLFADQIALLGMEEVDHLEADDPRAMLLLTYSGSLVTLGYGKERWLEYTSIKLRADVPDIVRSEKSCFTDPPMINSPAAFDHGPVRKTSALYKIVVCKSEVSAGEQEKRVREATIFITNSFIHLNRDLTMGTMASEVDQFNKKSIVTYLARKNGLTQDQTSGIVDDYISMLETGLLLGKTVSLGRLGRLSLKVKPKRKARIGRNPKTGDEITISARDAHFSPSFRFSSSTKERAAALPLPEDCSEEDQ